MSLASEKDLTVILTNARTSGLFYRVVWVLWSLSVTAASSVAALSHTKPVSARILHGSMCTGEGAIFHTACSKQMQGLKESNGVLKHINLAYS
jgi:hypothetical protein